MKQLFLSLTLALATLLTTQAQTSEYDPYYGFNGGWRFKDQCGGNQGGAQWDPYAGFNGGWRLQDQYGGNRGSWQFDPYAGFNGGWRYHPN